MNFGNHESINNTDVNCIVQCLLEYENYENFQFDVSNFKLSPFYVYKIDERIEKCSKHCKIKYMYN